MKTWNKCRVCDGPVELILSLGDQCVSNFLDPDEPDGQKAPLDLILCRECWLLQLKHTVPADAMYRNYWYRSGTNQTMRSALADIANKAEDLIHLQKGNAVLDIGCNDGTLLSSYKTLGIWKIGFDPAENLAVSSRKVADKVLVGFFDADKFLADAELRSYRPKVVTSIAMFYDLEEPHKFVADIKRVMHPDGVWIIQMSYLPLMLKQNDFGNICHEHLEYYSLQSLEYLLNRHDFEVADVELNDVNGGSYRIYVRNRTASQEAYADDAYRRQAAERVRNLRAAESGMRLGTAEPYLEFAQRVQDIKQHVFEFIKTQVDQNKKVYVYGASTKGNTMLQYFGLDNSLVEAAADRNPDKWGKVTVATRIPIVSETEARAARPDYFLVLPWHFLDEFTSREKDYLSSTGKFIVPMPEFSVV
jgi:cyclopropane fatty-acyl-phospholipid synthase-like methyltransferase